jgi:hypothetical protein
MLRVGDLKHSILINCDMTPHILTYNLDYHPLINSLSLNA